MYEVVLETTYQILINLGTVIDGTQETVIRYNGEGEWEGETAKKY